MQGADLTRPLKRLWPLERQLRGSSSLIRKEKESIPDENRRRKRSKNPPNYARSSGMGSCLGRCRCSRRRRTWVHYRIDSLLGVSRSGRATFRHCSAAGPGKWRVEVLDRIGVFSGISLPLRADELGATSRSAAQRPRELAVCCKKRRALEKMGEARLFPSGREDCNEQNTNRNTRLESQTVYACRGRVVGPHLTPCRKLCSDKIPDGGTMISKEKAFPTTPTLRSSR